MNFELWEWWDEWD